MIRCFFFYNKDYRQYSNIKRYGGDQVTAGKVSEDKKSKTVMEAFNMKRVQEDLRVVLSEAKSRAKAKYVSTKNHLKNPSEHGEYTINYWYARAATCDKMRDLAKDDSDMIAFEKKVAALMVTTYAQIEKGVSEPMRGTCDGALSAYDLTRGVLSDNDIELTRPNM